MSPRHLRYHRLAELEDGNEFHLRGVRAEKGCSWDRFEIEVSRSRRDAKQNG